MSSPRGRKRKYPLGEKTKGYPLDSELIKRIGRYGTANDTLFEALQNALKRAEAAVAAGIAPHRPVEREVKTFNLPESTADDVLAFAGGVLGADVKFETAVKIVIDLAEQVDNKV